MSRIGFFIATLLIDGVAVVACFAQPAPPAPPQAPSPFKYFVTASSSSFLGVGVAEVDTERAKELKLKEERGVEVKSVDDDSPASKAGVKVGDVVLDYNGMRVEGLEQFVRLVRETPVGRQVKLVIFRNGSNQTLAAAIGSRSSSQQVLPKNGEALDAALAKLKSLQKTLEMPDMLRTTMSMQNRMLGVETESLSSQLAEYFGVKEGALVRSVIHGSAAEKAGIKAGDVITKVGDRKVSSPGEVSSSIRATSGKALSLTIVRNQKEMTLNVTLDDRSSGKQGSPGRMDLKRL